MLPGRLSRKAELYGKARSTGCGLATSEFREGVGDGLQLRNSENSKMSCGFVTVLDLADSDRVRHTNHVYS